METEIKKASGNINKTIKTMGEIFNNLEDEYLKLKILSSLSRFRKGYDKSDVNMVLSFSGGKDSTVVLYLALLAEELGFIPKNNIDYVFADTKVEYDATYEFVKYIDKEVVQITYLTPRISFVGTLGKYGKPALSKVKSNCLSTWINNKDNNNRESLYRSKQILYSNFTHKKRNGEIKNINSHSKIANKHIHFLHDNLEYKISSKCCDIVKKEPFANYYIKHNTNVYFTGIRMEEGGVRSLTYTSCTSVKHIKNKVMYHIMPIYDWTTSDMESFIKLFNIPLSKCYTEYGLNRTGCIGCPYAKNIDENLKVLWKFEPKKYKFVMSLFQDVYIDQGVILDFDKFYMNKYKTRRLIINKRNKEMMEKYRKKEAD